MYTPSAHKVADTYQNYTTGATQNILVPNDVVQFKSDTDRSFHAVQEVFIEHQNELSRLHRTVDALLHENRAAFRSIAWISHHYPEVMHALESTMKATVVLDKANNLGNEVMEAP